ncbi:MAG: hypothetical protein FWE91_12335 [Defluviitaleaceae bacterium]|nr:hypothetical protein [Defluviitaleaceae bacterium]MCL2836538.1 hypothetical protein [Defluviitaleaceae bacterium]
MKIAWDYFDYFDYRIKTNEDFEKVLMLSGEEGYIKKKHLRSPIDFRFGLSRDSDGEWKMVFMLAGD